MNVFETEMEQWLARQVSGEANRRRRELLEKGIGHGTKEFLRVIWYPLFGNFDHLHAEWEVKDFGNRFRYLDLTYMPANAKGCIEIHGYRSHARDIEAWRFRDLCKKQAYLTLDDWLFLPIAYLSIEEEPEVVKQMILSFVGKFVSLPSDVSLSLIEAETIKFARGIIRPFHAQELALHLNRSSRQVRRVINSLLDKNMLLVHSDKQRYRTYIAAPNR